MDSNWVSSQNNESENQKDDDAVSEKNPYNQLVLFLDNEQEEKAFYDQSNSKMFQDYFEDVERCVLTTVAIPNDINKRML